MAIATDLPFSDVGRRFARLRVWNVPRLGTAWQITHLIRRNPNGGTPGDTLCGLTRFDRDGRKADIPGWGVEGGVFGPDIEQVECEPCRNRWRTLRHLNRRNRPWRLK